MSSARVRRPWSGRAVVVGAVLVGVLVGGALVACTGAADGGGTADPSDPSGPTDGGTGDLDLSSPLDPYLDEIWGDLSPDQPNPWALRAEELVAACMAAEGFEYRVDELVGVGSYRIPDEYGTVAFAEQYGYGESIPLEDGWVPRLWSTAPVSEGRAWNEAYREGLSEQARAAYDIALDGRYTEAHPDFEPFAEYDPAAAGCRGRAYDEVYAGGAVGPAEFAAVKAAVDAVWTRVEEDPRVVEALGRWSTCMADAGYPGLSHTMDAESLVATQIFAEWQDTWIAATETNLGVSDYDVVRTRIPEGLAELRQAEVDLAVTDARCREDTGYLETRRQVEVELEQEVVDTYRDDLEAWVAWIRENRPGG